MKKILPLTLASMLLSTSCSKSKVENKDTYAICIEDLTDKHTVHSDPNSLLSMLDFENNRDQQVRLDWVIISDMLLNPVVELGIPNKEETQKRIHGNYKKYREQQILSFYDSVRNACATLHTLFASKKELPQSECFCTISMNLRKLANSNAKRRILYVFSDLAEHNGFFSTYENEALVQNSPEEVAQLFNRRCPLPYFLNSIEVHFVFQPADAKQSQRYMDMITVYSLMLERRGANVFIQANNTSAL